MDTATQLSVTPSLVYWEHLCPGGRHQSTITELRMATQTKSSVPWMLRTRAAPRAPPNRLTQQMTLLQRIPPLKPRFPLPHNQVFLATLYQACCHSSEVPKE